MAMSEEPSSPLRLLNSELGMSQTQVNRPLLRRHRKSMRCADNNGQNCVFKSTKTLPISLAGRLITEIHYRFEDGQLQQIIGYFGSHKKSDGFEERMRQYYGKPSQSSPNQLRWKQGMEQLTLDADSIRLEKINAQ